MEALIKIQAELKAPKNQYNSFGKYNYRSQEDILEALKPLLAKYGCTLTIHDEIKEICGIPYVEATASIQKGDEGRTVTAQAGINPDRKGMDIAQSFGASSSYARKYALNGLFLIDDTKDADHTNDHGPKKPVLAKGEQLNKAMEFLRTAKDSKDAMQKLETIRLKYTLTPEIEKNLQTLINQL
jgi:hypothetical protein